MSKQLNSVCLRAVWMMPLYLLELTTGNTQLHVTGSMLRYSHYDFQPHYDLSNERWEQCWRLCECQFKVRVIRFRFI